MRTKFMFNVWVIMIAALVILLLLSSRTSAQDTAQPYACRDARYETVRIEFRNLPPDLFVWGNDDGYWYVADGASGYDNVIVADALTSDRDGYLAGTATLGVNINAFLLVGDANSPLCDTTTSPVQDYTPTPTAIPSAALMCPAWATNSTTGQVFCMWSLPYATNRPA